MKRIIFEMLMLLVATYAVDDSVIIPAPQYGAGAYIIYSDEHRKSFRRHDPVIVMPQQPNCPTPGYTPSQPQQQFDWTAPNYTQPNYQYDYNPQKKWRPMRK